MKGGGCTELSSHECDTDATGIDVGRISGIQEFGGTAGSRYPSPWRSSRERKPYKAPLSWAKRGRPLVPNWGMIK